MTMYYPTYRQQGDDNAIDVSALHQSLLLCVGLFSLLHLQQTVEGHMDEPVYELFLERMHAMEQQLSNSLQVLALEDVPF